MTLEEIKLEEEIFEQNIESLEFEPDSIKEKSFASCTFTTCKFEKTNLTDTDFEDCTFKNCELTICNLNATTLSDCTFEDCRLMGLDFSSINSLCFSPTFTSTMLDSCIFFKNRLKKINFTECTLRNCDFSSCSLIEMSFTQTRFQNTSFNENDMNKSDFTTASGYEINPYNNKVKGAYFSMPEVVSFLHFLGIKIV